MTEETFEKAEKLIERINVHRKIVDSACKCKYQANSLSIHANIPEETPWCYHVEGELAYQILELIHSAELTKLVKLEDEFKAL